MDIPVSSKRLIPQATEEDDGKFVSIDETGWPKLVTLSGGGALEASQANAENPATTNSTTYISPRRLYNALSVFKDSEQTFSERVIFNAAPRLTVGDNLILRTNNDGDIEGVATLSADAITDSATRVLMTPAERSKLSAVDLYYKGEHVNLAALEVAHPVGQAGWYAIIDGGIGFAPTKALWDTNDNEWVEASGAGASTFAELGGSPGDNAALLAALNAKQNSLGYTAENTANKNNINGYLGLDGTGKASADYIEDAPTRKLVSAVQIATWDAKQAALGFTPENVATKNQPSGYVGLDASSNLKLGGATTNARLSARGDGVNPIARFEDSVGSRYVHINSSGSSTSLNFNSNQGSILNTDGSQIDMFYGTSRSNGTYTAYSTGLYIWYSGVNKTHTSGTQKLLTISGGFSPTSGSGIYKDLEIAPTINQTGGASGATYALHINPTVTAAADFTSLQVDGGKVRIGANSGNSRLTVRGDGINAIVDFRDSSGFSKFILDNSGNATGLTSIAVAAGGFHIADSNGTDEWAIVVNDGILGIELL